MREIKFRGKVRIEGVPILGTCPIGDGEWIYGDLHLKCKYPHIHFGPGIKAPIDINTIGQYTGLKDANGKEIYEGDIVRYRLTDERYKKNPRYSNLPIHYDERQARFEAGNIYWDTLRSGKVEVIGNIHDNPELIDDKA